jgi:hypothetical protein
MIEQGSGMNLAYFLVNWIVITKRRFSGNHLPLKRR